DRPPAVERERDDERRHGGGEARLQAACQRVRHARRRKARAANFAPAIVSALSDAIVESGSRTIQGPRVSSPCASTRSRRRGSRSQPRSNPVAQITCKSRSCL